MAKKRSRKEKEDPLALKIRKNQEAALEHEVAENNAKEVAKEAFLKSLRPLSPETIDDAINEAIATLETRLETEVAAFPVAHFICFRGMASFEYGWAFPKWNKLRTWEEAIDDRNTEYGYRSEINAMVRKVVEDVKQKLITTWVKKHPTIDYEWSGSAFRVGVIHRK